MIASRLELPYPVGTFDPSPQGVRVQSGSARKVATQHLAEHAPELLALLKATGEAFGRSAWAEIEYDDETLNQDLREKLERNRGVVAKNALGQAKEALAR